MCSSKGEQQQTQTQLRKRQSRSRDRALTPRASAGEPRATPQPGFTGGTAVPSLLLAPVGSKADPAGLAGAATGPPEAPLTAREQVRLPT